MRKLAVVINHLKERYMNSKKDNRTGSTAMEQLAVGIDIGGTGTKYGIVDRVGNLLFSGEMSTRNHLEVMPYIDELYENIAAIGFCIGISTELCCRCSNYEDSKSWCHQCDEWRNWSCSVQHSQRQFPFWDTFQDQNIAWN